MKEKAALHFRDQFRHARAVALRDAEAFDEIIFVVERMGMFLTRKVRNLKNYKTAIEKEAKRSPLACEVPSACPHVHIPFSELFDLVQEGRNWAMHQGACARHLTNHATKLAIVLEDALMNGCNKVRDFMVPNPVCAQMWHPLSFIRQTMLENDFSFLPVNVSPDDKPVWKLLSDLDLARYLSVVPHDGERKRRLVQSLDEANATDPGGIQLRDPETRCPEDPVSGLFKKCDGQKDWDGLPILVVRNDPPNLLGILTSFDLL